jgi:hypothetical protein
MQDTGNLGGPLEPIMLSTLFSLDTQMFATSIDLFCVKFGRIVWVMQLFEHPIGLNEALSVM